MLLTTPGCRDKAIAFEAEDHLVDRWRGNPEVPLHVSLCGRLHRSIRLVSLLGRSQ